MNKNRFKAILALNGETQTELAKVLSLTAQTLSKKVNESCGAEFTQNEIRLIKTRYNLDASQVDQIFFGNEVSYKDTEEGFE